MRMAQGCGGKGLTGCAILILAAGASARMRGGDKLLEEVAGQPLLRVLLERALSVARGPVLCTLPAPDHPRAACLAGLAVTPVIVRDAAEGMGASIRAGITALPDQTTAAMILPADLPELTANDLAMMQAMHSAHPAAILRATDDDAKPGHPVVFPADLFPELATVQGDGGARDVLHRHADRVLHIPLPDRHATTDLDTPEDWAGWRARQ